ncbi:hypothetical protein SAMN02745195_02256, partial [Thermoanaerobacter uzonensis DSM 18761]
AIVVGVLAVISPTFREGIVNMVQHALDYASNFFNNAVQGK